MKVHQLLEHHGIARNPFADEDAQTDPVFKQLCIDNTRHPTWDKVYGDPREPSTSIVFGEKGSGKTAMRLQIARSLQEHNRQNPRRKLLVVHYDDFNHFLDRFRDRFARRRADRVLAHWKLWDHMDAILSLAVTGLVDRLLGLRQPSAAVDAEIDGAAVDSLDRHQARDLLLLAACYDQSTAETLKWRWRRLRKRLKFATWTSHWHFALGCLWTPLVVALMIVAWAYGHADWLSPLWLCVLLAVVGWAPWLWKFCRRQWLAWGVRRHVRVGNHDANQLRGVLMHFAAADLASQPLPNKDRTDDRYELLGKLQGLLQSLGFAGIVVLIDRVDEPHLINGSAELMKSLLWPMLDNKFLKHPGLGLKMMLPIELTRFIDREEREFQQRARLDKQNVVRPFQWTGEALYDVAGARLAACAADGQAPRLRDLFDESVSDARLMETLRTLRTPRRLFKFMHRLLVDHCNAHTEGEPAWKISPATFESTLAVFLREPDEADR